MDGYQQFLAGKAPKPRAVGFEPSQMHLSMRAAARHLGQAESSAVDLFDMAAA